MGIIPLLKEKDDLALVFDIGSSSVGGALFYREDAGPLIIFSVREPITFEEELDTDRFLSSTIKSLEIVAGKIHKAGLGAPSRVYAVISSPWYTSGTRTISFEKNEPFVFTEKLADNLIAKELSLFEEEYLTKHGHTRKEIRPIELKSIKTMLNGYETSNPLNQKAKQVEMTVFISMAPEHALMKMEEAIGKHFHFKSIKFSSFVMASFAVVRGLHIKDDNFLLIDIGGEVTDISMVKKNVLRESVSYPMGRNFIIRGAASALGSTFPEASSLIALFQSTHVEKATQKKLEPVLNKLKTEWLSKFQESLANISNDISIPATIYMAVGRDLAEFFLQTIQNEQFNQYTLTESKFEVIVLGTEILHEAASFEDNVTRDPFLLIDSIYINRFLNKI